MNKFLSLCIAHKAIAIPVTVGVLAVGSAGVGYGVYANNQRIIAEQQAQAEAEALAAAEAQAEAEAKAEQEALEAEYASYQEQYDTAEQQINYSIYDNDEDRQADLDVLMVYQTGIDEINFTDDEKDAFDVYVSDISDRYASCKEIVDTAIAELTVPDDFSEDETTEYDELYAEYESYYDEGDYASAYAQISTLSAAIDSHNNTLVAEAEAEAEAEASASETTDTASTETASADTSSSDSGVTAGGNGSGAEIVFYTYHDANGNEITEEEYNTQYAEVTNRNNAVAELESRKAGVYFSSIDEWYAIVADVEAKYGVTVQTSVTNNADGTFSFTYTVNGR